MLYLNKLGLLYRLLSMHALINSHVGLNQTLLDIFYMAEVQQ